jgi:glutamyl-tRNA synthetase
MPDKPPVPPVVTRFAPSPTGNLHIGGARTALFAWAFARKHGGQLILRIEDTDLARSTPESTKGILRDLTWLGLDWDQGPDPGSGGPGDPYDLDTQIGPHRPYFQSQRHEQGIYNELVQKLLDSGQAYEDQDAVRFRMDRDVAFNDVVFGPIEVKADDLEDFIIRKGEKGGRLPTFHLAVTVDDALMGVTHVIRGQEHLANTPKHAALCDALGFDRPKWVHLPSIMNADGSKMSKRDKAKAARKAAKDTDLKPASDTMAAFIAKENDDAQVADAIAHALGLTLPEIEVTDFQRSGYLPAVLLNYIALLGWNPGDDTERFDLDYLVQHFSPERIGKKNSQFDRAKLAKFNADTLAAMPADRFHGLLHKHFKAYHPDCLDKLGDTGFRTFAAMYQARSQTLSTPAELGRFFFCADDDIEYNAKAVKKNLTRNDGEGLKVLQQFRDELDTCDDWTADALHSLIESFVEKHRLKNMGSVAQPLRVALTGSAVSPEIGPTLELLGKQAVIARIDRCVGAVGV